MYVWALALTRDGRLVSGSWDKTIKIWNHDYSLYKTLDSKNGGHIKWVLALAVIPDGRLISGSYD